MKNRNLDHSDNWETPSDLYSLLNKEFNFDFDPCPINYGNITPENDGLLISWGKSNFINPPYNRKLKEAFVMKAVAESKKGKICVCLIPVSTSTKLFHEVILPNSKDIRFIRGRVKFTGINTKNEYVNFPDEFKENNKDLVFVNDNGMHDSMVVVF